MNIITAAAKIATTTKAVSGFFLGNVWGRGVTIKSKHTKCMQVVKREYKQYLRNG